MLQRAEKDEDFEKKVLFSDECLIMERHEKQYGLKTVFSGQENRPMMAKNQHTRKFLLSAFVAVDFGFFKLFDVTGDDLTPVDDDFRYSRNVRHEN